VHAVNFTLSGVCQTPGIGRRKGGSGRDEKRGSESGRKYAPKEGNVQKKYILLPKYLLIPNIYSTFAAGFDLKGEW